MTPKQEAFVREYLVDLNATQAALRAGYAAKQARSMGWENLRKPEVAAALEEAMKKRAKRVDAKADDVLREWVTIAQADPRELIEFRRSCCRYCWGAGFRYQRTAGEMERARAQHAKEVAVAEEREKPPPGPFDEQGGIGYHAKRDPNPDCPECFGDGIGETFVHDTRRISTAAARLYAGVEQSKEGLKLRLRSQDDAHINLARHLGMFNKDKSGGGTRVIIKDMTGRKRGDSGG